MNVYNSECTDFTFGSKCSQSCQCNKTNTVSCNPVTGQCSCKLGWTGLNCSMDIDECNDNLTKCNTSMYHVCINTPGSAYCDCQFGGRNSTLCNGTNFRLPQSHYKISEKIYKKRKANKHIQIVIPPANKVWGVYGDPYVRPLFCPFVRPSLPISNPLLL